MFRTAVNRDGPGTERDDMTISDLAETGRFGPFTSVTILLLGFACADDVCAPRIL